MAKDYTAQKLAESVKRRASMPTSQSLFEVSDLVAFMGEEIQSTIAPEMSAVREEYFIHIEDVPIVTTQESYVIPNRAMGNALRDIDLLDPSGNEINLPRLDPTILKTNPSQTSNRLFGFYVQNEKVFIFPNADSFGGYFVRFRFKRRTSDLVTKTESPQIAAINTALKQITVSVTPSGWTTATEFDFIANVSPFVSKGDDRTISAIGGNVLTFDATLPTDLAVGDWVAEANFSPVPQIPYIAFNWLSQLTVVRALEALGDNKGLENAYKAEARMRNEFIKIITPRTQGSPQKINNRNGIFDWATGFGTRRGRTY